MDKIEYQDETCTLNSFIGMNRFFMLVCDKESIKKNYVAIEEKIQSLKRSSFYVIEAFIDRVDIVQEIAGELKSEMANNLLNKYTERETVYLLNGDNVALMCNGKRIENDLTSYYTKREMAQKLGLLKPITYLKAVFEHFKIDCYFDSYYRENTFNGETIKSEINENELRNYLLEYLNKIMRGTVRSEHITDISNPKEACDISVNDGTQIAFIEVKYARNEKYIDDSKSSRSIKNCLDSGFDGMEKYILHTTNNGVVVNYIFLYIFCAIKKSEEEIERCSEEYCQSKEISKELESAFNGIVVNDMNKWGNF